MSSAPLALLLLPAALAASLRSRASSRPTPSGPSTPAGSRRRAKSTPRPPKPRTCGGPQGGPAFPERLGLLHRGQLEDGAREPEVRLHGPPHLVIAADFYSPDFARLAQSVRAEVAGASAPPPDLAELKRTAREKLADGKAEDALYDLKRASPPTTRRSTAFSRKPTTASGGRRSGRRAPQRRGPRARARDRRPRIGAPPPPSRGPPRSPGARRRRRCSRPPTGRSAAATCGGHRRWRAGRSIWTRRSPKRTGWRGRGRSPSARTPMPSGSTPPPSCSTPATRARSSAWRAWPRGRRSGTRPRATTAARWS